jgi:predicted transcriptional regulator
MAKRTTKPELNFRNTKVYLYVLSHINQKNPEKIADQLKVSMQNLNKYISRLKKLNYIKKLGYATWELTKEGKEFLNFLRIKQITKPSTLGLLDENLKVNLHALTITVPILSGKLDFKEKGYEQGELRGWIPQYLRISSPLGLTLKNNNNKSVTIYLWSREIPKTFDINSLVIKSLLFTHNKLKEEQNVTIDIMDSKVSTLHLSVKNEDLDLIFNKGEKFEVVLNRSVKKILPKDEDKPAKAWVDSTPYLGIETNDIDYKENLIMMPERVNKLMEFLPETVKVINELKNEALIPLTKQIALHLEVEQKQSNNQDKMNQLLEKLNNSINELKPKESLFKRWFKRS